MTLFSSVSEARHLKVPPQNFIPRYTKIKTGSPSPSSSPLASPAPRNPFDNGYTKGPDGQFLPHPCRHRSNFWSKELILGSVVHPSLYGSLGLRTVHRFVSLEKYLAKSQSRRDSISVETPSPSSGTVFFLRSETINSPGSRMIDPCEKDISC